MAEPYSDEELPEYLERMRATSAVGYGDPRLVSTVLRLQRERDEARRERDEGRRVARVLVMESRPGAVKHHTAREWSNAVKTALAYPEVPHD